MELRTDIVEKLSMRREARGRHREERPGTAHHGFKNRRKADGWIAPSVRHKVNCHLNRIAFVRRILPERASSCRDTAFMGSMRRAVYGVLKDQYKGFP